jgi:hypothetical protein
VTDVTSQTLCLLRESKGWGLPRMARVLPGTVCFPACASGSLNRGVEEDHLAGCQLKLA